jgi:outer membrane protein OmpA-like peptidoglycan-associated protein
MFRLILIHFLLLSGLPCLPAAWSQHADCDDPLVLELTPENRVFEWRTPPDGPGKRVEISGPQGSPFFFEVEHHSMWYSFRVPFSGLLRFEITPLDPSNDYDFMLYKDTVSDFCTRLEEKKIFPVRSVISRNDTLIGSRTGLSFTAQHTHIHSGPGESYAPLIRVRKGETFFLVLDNVYGGGSGHRIEFHYYFEPVFSGKVVDAETGDPLQAQVQIEEAASGLPVDSFANEAGSGEFNFKVPLEYERDYLLFCTAEGYFSRFRRVNRKVLRELRNRPFLVELQAIRVGANVILDDIFFVGGEAVFLDESRPSLRRLLQTMRHYPALKIRIEGHVHWAGKPDCDTDPFSQELSDNRAKAVREFLVENGIAPGRMETIGYGCTRMIHPFTDVERLAKENRRVELKVLDF